MPARRVLVAVLLWTASSTVASAAVGFRQLTSVFPCAVQRGTTATVQVRSNFTLDGAYRVFFDEPGIEMKLAETKPIAAPLEGRGRPGTPFRFAVTVPPAQDARIYEVRIATPVAVSSVTHLRVTDHPVVVEGSKNNGTPATAENVTVPAAVCGVCDEPEDVDCYRFDARKGETWTMQIFAQRMTAAIHDMVGKSQTYHMDPILTLVGPNGQIVAMNDNVVGGDAVLISAIPQDGAYVLTVRDTRYLGNPRYTYCVEISRGAAAVATFPPVVAAGRSAEVEVLTFGGRSIGRARIDARDAKSGLPLRVRPTIDGEERNPIEVETSTEPQVTHDRTDGLDRPRELSLPVGIGGRLNEPGAAHAFSFAGKKDAYYSLTMRSRRFQLPVDAVLEVYDAAGKKLAEADDLPLSADAELAFRAPADGRYTVLVRDLHGRGGPEFVYHLRIAQAEPDFEIVGKYYYAMLGPGTRALWFAGVTRRNGFEGPIDVVVEGLPPGVSQTPVTVPPGMTNTAVILSAEPKARVGASLVRIVGRAKVVDPATGREREIVREGIVTCELQSGGGSQGHWPVRTSLVGVVEPMDLLKVEATPTELTIPQGGKAEVTVKIERNKDYKDPVTVDFTWMYFTSKLGEQLPPGVAVGKGSTARLSGNTLEGKIMLEASSSALPVRRLPIAVMAGVSISFSIDTKYASNPILLTVVPAGEGKSQPVARK